MRTAIEFWTRAIPQSNGCMEWAGARMGGKRNYGSVRWQGRNMPAHRVAWELVNGPAPDGMDICHTCDNPPCVNPLHLFVGTREDNMRDASRKGRLLAPKNLPRGDDHWARQRPELLRRGATNGRAVIDESEVMRLRALHSEGASIRGLARQFGISQSQAGNIVHRRQWAHI